MNICITNTREFDPQIGGVEKVSCLLAQAFMEKGHRVIFLSGIQERDYEDEDVKSYFFPDSQSVSSARNIAYVADLINRLQIDVVLNQAANIASFSDLWNKVKNITDIKLISVIHFSPDYAIRATQSNFFIAPVLGYNPVKWGRNLLMCFRFHLYRKKQMMKELKNYYRSLEHLSDAVVLLSSSYRSFIHKIVGSDEKLRVIPNPVKSKISDVNLNEKRNQILYLGRLEYGLKRVDRLIPIWKKLSKEFPSWEFIIVGDGHIRTEAENMVNQQNIERIHFAGFQNPEEYLKNTSILSLVSTNEGFPMALIEAQQYGCVPIAYNSFSALADIIDDGVNGYAVTPFSEQEYISRLRLLMEDAPKRRHMAEAGIKTCRKFDVHNIAEQWEELFTYLNE